MYPEEKETYTRHNHPWFSQRDQTCLIESLGPAVNLQEIQRQSNALNYTRGIQSTTSGHWETRQGKWPNKYHFKI